jgi:hypothetical protein
MQANKKASPFSRTGRNLDGQARQWRFGLKHQSFKQSVALGLDNLTAAIHAGLEIDMMRAAKLAAVFVFNICCALKRIGRTAEPALHRRRLPFGDCHLTTPFSMLRNLPRQ